MIGALSRSLFVARSAYASTAFSTLWFTLLAGLGGVIATRALGPYERGLLATAVVWSTVVGSVIAYGVPGVATYFTARDRATPPRAASTVLALGLAAGVAVGLVGAGASLLLVGSAAGPAMAVAFIGLVAVAPGGAALGAILGLGAFRLWGLLRLVGPTLTLLGTIAVVLVDLRTAVAIAAVTALAAVAQLALLLAAMRRRGLLTRPSGRLVEPIVAYAWRNIAGGSAWLTISQVDQLALSVAVAPQELAMYAVAASFGAIIYSLGASAGVVALHRIASGGAVAARDVLRRGLVGAGLMVAALCSVTFVTAGSLVPFVFGASFAPATVLLRILLVGVLVRVIAAILADVMRGLGQPLALANASMVGAAVMAVGLPIMIPAFGTAGAAVVSVACSCAMLLVMIRKVRGALDSQTSPQLPDPAETAATPQPPGG